MLDIKSQIKILLIENNMTMSQLVIFLNYRFQRTDTIQNLNNKLTRGTIKYVEIQEIMEVLKYDIVFCRNTDS